MYRVIAIIGAGLALAACSSTGELGSLDAFKPGAVMDTVSIESEPSGAQAKASNGQSCQTPCALALPVDQPMTVTFSLNGYEPQTEQLEVITGTGEPPRLRPNPLYAELTPAAAKPAKPARKKVARKPVAKKKAAEPVQAAEPAAQPAASAAPVSAPSFAPPPSPAASPWPAPPPQH